MRQKYPGMRVCGACVGKEQTMKTFDEIYEGNWLIHCKCQSNDFEKASNCVKLVVRLTLAMCRGILDDGLEHSKVLSNHRCSFS